MMTERTPRTMVGYIRVSRRMGREGPGYISKDVQREAIERWAAYKDVRILDWHIDEDESGGRHQRPGLERAVARAVTGETGGIVSWKIDRFSRYTEGGLRDLRRLEEAGARLAFVVEDIDTSGPMGKFVYTVMLAMSEYFLDNIKAGWRTAKARAIERGAHIARPGVGLLANGNGTLKPDPERKQIVVEAFDIALAGDLGAVRDFLVVNVPDHTWTMEKVRAFLSRPAYVGDVNYGELVCTDAHEALVSRATFNAVQRVLGAEQKGQRQPKGDFPLSQIARCAHCGGPLVGSRGGNDNRRMYRCATRCGKNATALSAGLLEAHVVAVLREAFQHPGFRAGDETVDTSAEEADVREAETDLDALASDLKARKLLGDRYHQYLEQRVEAVKQAQDALDAKLSLVQRAKVVVPAELWDDLEPDELAEVLRGGLDKVIVAKGRGPLAERVRVVPKGMDRLALATAEDSLEGSLEP